MAKAKPSAQAELDELRERAAAERVKQRHLGDALETARAHVEQADEAISSAYEAEDDAAIAAARVALADAEAEADDLARRHAALDSRIRAAQATVDAYVEKHADDLSARL